MLHYFRLVGLALLLSVGIGSGNTLSAQIASPSLQINKLFQIANVLELPQGDAKIPYNCNYAVVTPKTQEGEIVKDKLWAVTSEETVGNYTFVSFVGKMVWLTINFCEVSESNIAVFQNGHLKFIISTAPGHPDNIGALDIVDGGVIRILSNRRPIAEIRIREDTLSFEPVSQVQSFCDGSVLVPNIHGNSIFEARQRLFTFGFKPQKINDNDPPLYGAADLREVGVTEVSHCYPSGMAACQLNYFSEDDYLEVYTVGEYDREVNSYEIFCGVELVQPQLDLLKFKRLTGVDLFGDDLTSKGFKGISLAECEAICSEDSSCKAYSFIEDKQWCFPKHGSGNKQENAGVISGIRFAPRLPCTELDSEGRTPLHYLVKKESPSKLEALLQDTSDLICVDKYGETPLHFAAALGTSEHVSLLLKYGANPNLINKGGETPLGLALGNPSMAGTAALSELKKLTTIEVTEVRQEPEAECLSDVTHSRTDKPSELALGFCRSDLRYLADIEMLVSENTTNNNFILHEKFKIKHKVIGGFEDWVLVYLEENESEYNYSELVGFNCSNNKFEELNTTSYTAEDEWAPTFVQYAVILTSVCGFEDNFLKTLSGYENYCNFSDYMNDRNCSWRVMAAKGYLSLALAKRIQRQNSDFSVWSPEFWNDFETNGCSECGYSMGEISENAWILAEDRLNFLIDKYRSLFGKIANVSLTDLRAVDDDDFEKLWRHSE